MNHRIRKAFSYMLLCSSILVCSCRISWASTISEVNTVDKDTGIVNQDGSVNEDKGAMKYMERIVQTYYIDQTKDAESLWENEVSQRSKDMNIMSKDEYIAYIKKVFFENSFEDYLVNSQQELSPNAYAVSVTLKMNGGSTTTEDWFVLKENGEYKLILKGIIDMIEYKNVHNNTNEFYLENLVAYKTVYGMTISCDFINNSGRPVVMGPWASTCIVSMTTTTGKNYTSTFDTNVRIEANSKDTFTMNFDSTEGIPRELVFETITYVGSNGLPEGTTSYNVSFE